MADVKKESYLISWVVNEGSAAYVRHTPDGCTLYALYTEPEYRNKGFATDILETAKALAASKGHRLTLFYKGFRDKPLSDQQLYEFYAKRGFIRRVGGREIDLIAKD